MHNPASLIWKFLNNRQLALDIGIALGLLVFQFLIGLIFPAGSIPSAPLFLILTCAALFIIGNYAALIYRDFSTIPDIAPDSPLYKRIGSRLLVFLFLGIAVIYLFSLVMVQPFVLFMPVASQFGGFLGKDGGMSYFTLFVMAAPFAFTGLGFASCGGLNTASVKPFITLTRIMLGLLFLAFTPFLFPLLLKALPQSIRSIQIAMGLTAAAGIITVVLPTLLLKKFLLVLTKPESRTGIALSRFWDGFLFSVILSFVLSAWNDGLMRTMAATIMADRKTLAAGDFILLLLIGPYPLRVLAAFRPPYRLLNMIITVIILVLAAYELWHDFFSFMPAAPL